MKKQNSLGFNPAFTPHQMLRLGVFEGKYLNSTMGEYPSSWARGAKLSDTPDPSINAFGRKSRQPLSVWKDSGWIHPQDPWGWFQWYCRYYTGRRTEDDLRQIKRWRSFVRHSAQVLKNGQGDPTIRPTQRQALLQWSYDPFPDVRAKTNETICDKVKRKLDI
jgi:hypothetical protein